MPTCLVGLGSNLGDRAAILNASVQSLNAEPDVAVIAVSRWIETRPVGGPSGQWAFLNGAVRLETSLPPENLLSILRRTETESGRDRRERWGPRTLDLDLLLYGDRVIDSPTLTVPHPRMAFRPFVLKPAAEIAGDMVHPTTGWTIERLWRHLCDARNYIALAGPALDGKRTPKALFATNVCDVTGATLLAGFEDYLEYRLAEGSAGRAERVAIEFLERWAELLKAAPGEDARWHVSDFWFGQLPLITAGWLTAAQQQSFVGRWKTVAGALKQPKLVVILEPPTFGPTAKSDLDEIARAIVGPSLRVATRDWDAALGEVVAAVAAMTG
jgi:2-amino-4-hydroxy-6-hydroxymethyldihydropteridine diphosphokinase